MLTAMTLMIAGATSQPIYVPPRCKAPPRYATPQCRRCYEEECATFIVNWEECDGDPDCSELALLVYSVQLVNCACGLHLDALLAPLNEAQQRDAVEMLAAWPR